MLPGKMSTSSLQLDIDDSKIAYDSDLPITVTCSTRLVA